MFPGREGKNARGPGRDRMENSISESMETGCAGTTDHLPERSRALSSGGFCLFLFLFYYFLRRIYLFEMQLQIERERKQEILSAGSLPETLPQLGLG